MKIKILTLIILFSSTVFAQRKEVILYSEVSNVTAGQIVDVYTSKDGSFVVPVKELFTLTWNDNTNLEPIEVSTTHLQFAVPDDVKDGTNKLYVDVEDGPYGTIYFSHIGDKDKDSLSDASDPDPDTQNGDYGDIGSNPNPNDNSITVNNPSGGHKNLSQLPCHNFHIIDGIFSKLENSNFDEWEGITPLQGLFSRLYLDYCDSTMYLMNDWFVANGDPHSSCYNKFEFYTGGGAEYWVIKIPEDTSKNMSVIRNGIDVSTDTNIVLGGEAGFGQSIVSKFDHTLYEFAIRILPGRFFIPSLTDPVRPQTPTVVCDDEGYGVITEPKLYAGNFSNNGTTLSKFTRYIPTGKIAGLEKEPNVLTGDISDKICYKFGSESKSNCYECTDNKHVIDGVLDYQNLEWTSAPAKGRWSNLYAEYCDSILYVLNDWVLANYEPDHQSCYNLFELYSGNYTEHWGIFVYHDIERGMKVFRNGIDVTGDTNYVVDGKYGFGRIGPNDSSNAIYEWGLKVQKGNFVLQMADPGPSSFCDDAYKTNPAPRNYSNIDIAVNGAAKNNNSTVKLQNNVSVELAYSLNTIDTKKKFLGYEIEVVYESTYFSPQVNSLSNDFDFTFVSEIIENTPTTGYNTLRISTNEKSLIENIGKLLEMMFTANIPDNVSTNILTTVKFYNENANLYSSSDLSITFDNTKSSVVDDIFNAIKIYPSIASNYINIEYAYKGNKTLDILLINNIGKVLATNRYESNVGDNHFTLPINQLSSGVYYLLIKVDNSSKLLRFVKQ